MNALDLVFQLGQWGQHHPRELLYGVAALPVLAGLAGVAARRRQHASEVLGSARWATAREIRRANLMQPHGVVVGRLGRQLLQDDSEKHVLLCAPTGAGKGVGIIIPTLLTWQESVLVLDPKDGENLAVTGRWRSRLGQVEAFTPCRAPHACINVLDTIRLGTHDEFADAQLIAQSLVDPGEMAVETATSLHFRELAGLLLTAAILHVCYTAQRKSLAGVWAFLTQQHGSLADCLKAMTATAHHKHSVHQAIAAMTTAMKNITGDRELSSVWTTAIRPLVLYNDPLVAASTDTSTLDLTALQHDAVPRSLYLVAPSPKACERLHPLYRVVLDVALAHLMDSPVRSWRHRLFVCGDELPWFGYIRAIDTGIAVMRGYGIKSLVVTQGLPNLERVYGSQTAIWDNTDVKIFHAPTNDVTAKRISENLIGRGTVDHPVESRQAGLLGRRSVSMQHVARPLLMPNEVMELDPRLEIVRLSGCKPMLCAKVNYLTDREFRGRWEVV
jgi:type IV secretion system protein VirD4